MDGTLLDTESVFKTIVFEVCTDLGYEMTEAVHLSMVGGSHERTNQLLVEAYGVAFPYTLFDERCRVIMRERSHGGVPVKAGARELIGELRERGIPCAASSDASSFAELEAFATAVGFPLILKPRDAAGASGTYRVDNVCELHAAARQLAVDRGNSVAIEEFIEGHEGFYDTLTVGGRVVHEFVSHYYPNVLEAMRTRWISPQIVVTNRIDEPGYEELRALGRRVNAELAMGTSATHMEWFYGPRGLKFSEIGARPPGVSQWDSYNAANDIDLYREWAHAIVHVSAPGHLSRRYAAGIIALRPDRDGHISGYQGLEEIQQRYGQWIVEAHVPDIGTATQPVEAGYMANAWVRMKHPDYDVLREMLDDVGRTVQVRAA